VWLSWVGESADIVSQCGRFLGGPWPLNMKGYVFSKMSTTNVPATQRNKWENPVSHSITCCFIFHSLKVLSNSIRTSAPPSPLPTPKQNKKWQLKKFWINFFLKSKLDLHTYNWTEKFLSWLLFRCNNEWVTETSKPHLMSRCEPQIFLFEWNLNKKCWRKNILLTEVILLRTSSVTDEILLK
jgi:hypothetical protein